MLESLKVPVACSCTVPPLVTSGFVGDIAIEVSVAVLTLRFAEADCPSYSAPMVVAPGVTAVASPSEFTVAIVLEDELQIAELVTSTVLLSESVARAENRALVLRATLDVAGVSTNPVTVAASDVT